MFAPQPTQRRAFLLRWVGLSFLGVAALAQTPVPQATTSTPPALPTIQSAESGQQLVQRAEAALQQSGNAAQALALYQTAAQAFQQSGEIEAAALSWHRVAQLTAKAGYPAQAKTAAEKARMLLRVRTLPMRTATGLSTSQAARAYLTLGRVHLEAGEMREAVNAYQAGLSLALEAQLPREAAAGFVALGLIAAQADEFEVAIRMTTNSLEHWRAAKDFSGEAMALNNLARFYERKGDLPLAAQFDAEAIHVTRFSRNHQAEAESLLEAMRLHMILGNYHEAATAGEQLIGLARLSGDQRKESEHTMALALLEAQRNKLPSAYQLLLKAFIIGSATNAAMAQQVKDFLRKIEALPKSAARQAEREQLLAEAEFEATRGDFSAAYQLLLRALLMNEGQSDVMNAALNARIKALSKQIEARQKQLAATRP
jgi:tetratricopeptide (TPR) repeat protein